MRVRQNPTTNYLNSVSAHYAWLFTWFLTLSPVLLSRILHIFVLHTCMQHVCSIAKCKAIRCFNRVSVHTIDRNENFCFFLIFTAQMKRKQNTHLQSYQRTTFCNFMLYLHNESKKTSFFSNISECFLVTLHFKWKKRKNLNIFRVCCYIRNKYLFAAHYNLNSM